MKLRFVAFLTLFAPLAAFAAGGGYTYPHDSVSIDWDNKASMQRGAQLFANYCLSCHEAAFARYNRMGKDLGIEDSLVSENLIFTTDKYGEPTKVGSLMKTNMSKEYGEEAFGAAPPDLSLIARSRGTDWLYNYMRGFYVDPTRPFGVNNGVFPSVGMPHVLVELQGLQKPIFEEHDDGHGGVSDRLVGFEPLTEGTMTTAEYDQAVKDLVGFLDYLGEPYKQTRQSLGVKVILFLLVLLVLSYLLKKEYWRDIH